MHISLLDPAPTAKCLFKRKEQRLVPDAAGCYVLTTFEGEVLYVGLSVSLKSRLGQHLDDKRKTGPTSLGRAFFFHWVERTDLERVERTWMNTHTLHEGKLPELNGAYSPVST
jgi:hypothetical protein